ncbi:MAG: hypothetical protein QF619_10870, partial [Candidatus Binatia bacterium]|nr:hypothetical protein [Candidatus Binatia bacterium]
PQREAAREAVETPVSSFAPGSEAYMSPVDGSGSRMVWLTKGQAGSGLALLQGVVNDRDGLMQAGGGLLRRKELRRMISEMKEKHGFTMVPVPWAYVDNLLYEAYEKAKGTGRPGLEQFTSLRSHISSARPEQRPHPVYDHFKRDDVLSGPGRESSQGLLEEPEFRSWILEEDWIKPYLEQLCQVQESRLVLNPAQKEERMGGIVRGAIQEIFSGEVGTLMVGRMEDMALILALTGREDRARSSLAVALTLKEEKIGGLGPGNPFLEGLVQKTMSYYVVQEQEKEKEKESSLLIKP